MDKGERKIALGEITKVTTANHAEWLALRQRYIGGSDAAAVVGLNPFASAYSLWAEKTGRVPAFSGNLATEVGSYLEEFVAQKFAAETGKKVRRVKQSFLNRTYPFAIANIDREIVGEDAGLEIKTTSELNMKRFAGGEYPANYYVQCVHYLAVTGKQRWYLAVLIGNRELKIFTIERDDAEIAALMTAERDFWAYLEKDTPPPVDGAPATTETVKALYAQSDDHTVDLSGYREELEQYVALGRQIRELEAIQAEAANRIKAYLGDAAEGDCGGYHVTWRSAARRTFDSKYFAEQHPDMDLSGYYRESASRMFRVTETKE